MIGRTVAVWVAEARMKIGRITLSHHAIELDPPFHAAWDSRPRKRFEVALVRVETDDGLTGIGAGGAMPGFAGHEDLFVGEDPRDLDRHFQVIDNLSFHGGRYWPLDIALWDLFGKIVQQPCWRLLGGAGSRLRLYASSGRQREPNELAELARHYLANGYQAMKVRFRSADWRADLAGIEAIRREVGDQIELMVDANQGWRMPWDTHPPWSYKQALEVARALEHLEVYWLEEPLHRRDVDGMAALRGATTIRIAGGEMARELHDLDAMIERRAVDVLQPDAALIGGLTGLARIGQRARAQGLAFSPHTWGDGIVLVANAHLAAGVGACPFLEFPYDPDGWTAARRDFALQAPLEMEPDGWLSLSEAPGLGIELDEELLAATLVGAAPPAPSPSAPPTMRRWWHWWQD